MFIAVHITIALRDRLLRLYRVEAHRDQLPPRLCLARLYRHQHRLICIGGGGGCRRGAAELRLERADVLLLRLQLLLVRAHELVGLLRGTLGHGLREVSELRVERLVLLPQLVDPCELLRKLLLLHATLRLELLQLRRRRS